MWAYLTNASEWMQLNTKDSRRDAWVRQSSDLYTADAITKGGHGMNLQGLGH